MDGHEGQAQTDTLEVHRTAPTMTVSTVHILSHFLASIQKISGFFSLSIHSCESQIATKNNKGSNKSTKAKSEYEGMSIALSICTILFYIFYVLERWTFKMNALIMQSIMMQLSHPMRMR